MNWAELLMLITVLIIMVLAAMYDCTSCRIPNRMLFAGAIIICVLYYIEFQFFKIQYWPLVIKNAIGMILISIVLYATNIWAAGDSKLLIVLSLGIPATLYSKSDLIPAPCFAIVIIAFSIAYIYATIDTIAHVLRGGISNINFLSPSALIRTLLDVAFYGVCIYLLDIFIAWVMPSVFDLSKYSFIIINFCAIFIFQMIFQNRHTIMIWTAIIGNISLFIGSVLHLIVLSPLYFNVWNVLLILFVFLINSLSIPYNYQTISTENVKAQMIPAASTVLLFQESKIKGLPTCMSEDLRARLSNEQVNAILKWNDSKLGKPQITIVRKIPFALFIAIGTIIFIGMEMLK